MYLGVDNTSIEGTKVIKQAILNAAATSQDDDVGSGWFNVTFITPS